MTAIFFMLLALLWVHWLFLLLPSVLAAWARSSGQHWHYICILLLIKAKKLWAIFLIHLWNVRKTKCKAHIHVKLPRQWHAAFVTLHRLLNVAAAFFFITLKSTFLQQNRMFLVMKVTQSGGTSRKSWRGFKVQVVCVLQLWTDLPSFVLCH